MDVVSDIIVEPYDNTGSQFHILFVWDYDMQVLVWKRHRSQTTIINVSKMNLYTSWTKNSLGYLVIWVSVIEDTAPNMIRKGVYLSNDSCLSTK